MNLKYHLSLFLCLYSASSFAVETSVETLGKTNSSEDLYVESPQRIEPMSSNYYFRTSFLPKAVFAPRKGSAVELTTEYSQIELRSKENSDSLRSNARTTSLMASVAVIPELYFGIQGAYLSQQSRDGYLEIQGSSDPTLTVGTRFGSRTATALLSLDYTVKTGPAKVEFQRKINSQNNKWGAEIVIPRIAGIFQSGDVKYGGSIAYGKFGGPEIEMKTAWSSRKDNYEAAPFLKYSAFYEYQIRQMRLGLSGGYFRFDTFRTSTQTAEGYLAFGLSSNLSLTPSVAYSRGVDENSSDTRSEMTTGALALKGTF